MMADDLDRPYEPWVPRAGQRVRVRISPECRCTRGFFTDGVDTAFEASTVEISGHDPDEEGAIGTVHSADPYDPDAPKGKSWEAHRFYVEFEPGVVTGVTDYPQECMLYAAIELEPVDDDE